MPKTYNTISSVSTGDVYTATAHNAIAQNINNLRVPPVCILSKNISLTNAGVTWDFPLAGDEEADTDDMHSTSSNTTRVTPGTAGIYLVTASTVGQGNYSVSVQVAKNGSVIATQSNDNGTYVTSCSVATVAVANGSTDYFTIIGYSTTTATYPCRFTVAWLGQVS